jgi:alcohol dehydrogenase class IV
MAGAPHAETNAVMLPRTMRFMTAREPEALGRLAEALGTPGSAADGLEPLAARAGLTTLSDLGIDAGALPAIARAALAHPGIAAMDPPLAEDEVLALLRDAL